MKNNWNDIDDYQCVIDILTNHPKTMIPHNVQNIDSLLIAYWLVKNTKLKKKRVCGVSMHNLSL